MNKKLLIIIKSHDKKFCNYNNELYEQIENTTKNYLSNKKEIDFVFAKANPLLKNNYHEQENNIFWVNTEENHWTSLKIKVLESLNHFFNQNDKKYDYVFVTNLSTFINVDKLLEECESISETECGSFTGVYSHNNLIYQFPSGAGVLYGKGLVTKMLEIQKTIRHEDYPDTDDVFFGLLLTNMGIKIKKISRMEIAGEIDLSLYQNINNFSHIRIKFNSNRNFEIKYHLLLANMIYNLEK